MSSMLTRLTDVEYKPSFWEAFWERWLPLSKVEAETLLAVKARALADTALFEAEAARIQLDIDQKKLEFQREQDEKDAVRRAEQAVVEAATKAEKEKRILAEQLRPVFIAKAAFKRGKESGYHLIVQCGESKNGETRGVLGFKVTTPAGTVGEMTQGTKDYFYTTRLWTNLVHPWIQFTISTEDVKASNFESFNTANERIGWLEFPLFSPKKKEK
jgi:hypothetical protein